MKNTLIRFGLDAALAVALCAALLAVVGVDALINWLHPTQPTGPSVTEVTDGTETPRPKTKPLTPRRPTLAVTKPFIGPNNPAGGNGQPWDDIGRLLDSLGEGYRYDVLDQSELQNLETLKKYNVVFYSCGADGKQDKPVLNTLNAYVAGGGTLYASDWRYDIIAAAFPEVRASSLIGSGLDTEVNADVVDPGLKDVFGEKLRLSFDLSGWKTAAFQGDRVKVLLKGKYHSATDNVVRSAPLLVRFDFGRGNVIFTSYHHGKNNSEDERKLLKYLVLSLVTAREETGIDAAALKNQFTSIKSTSISFSPQKGTLFSGGREEQKVSFNYQHSQPGKLRFDLVFLEEGAEMELTLKSPSGKLHQKKDKKSFSLEIPDAEAGNWSYTVSALDVPYENFAVRVKLSQSAK